MIQLMLIRKERQTDLDNINSVKENLKSQETTKEEDIQNLKKNIRMMEGEIKDISEKMKKLEHQQAAIKKVEEFNALSHEMSQTDRERTAKELKLADLIEKLSYEEEILTNIKQTLKSTVESSQTLEEEILENIHKINAEGRVFKSERDLLVNQADSEVFRIYERLLRNKKDRVVVPIENRCCSGCHIALTAQHENLVRKGERLVFCEHCSRIHYWPESEVIEGPAAATKQRRRRATSKV
jgi:predicted  nucleic acid-binding Zn-ribbon protein